MANNNSETDGGARKNKQSQIGGYKSYQKQNYIVNNYMLNLDSDLVKKINKEVSQNTMSLNKFVINS